MSKVNQTSKLAAVIVVLVLTIAGHVPAGQTDYANPAITNNDSSAYWLDQGGLFSAYGNYPAAIRAYEKSLARDPGNSEAHFGIGVALGAMGDYTTALTRIDQALAMAADNGRYLYGRGWVLMLAGRTDEALPVLRKASEQGNMDARMFLQYLETR
ncbi:MAG: tetratricopeptide repeat protein [Desulfatitalea sp.]|nr:tetratricopeptide repeat protein [Desulfatitalea sp.]